MGFKTCEETKTYRTEIPLKELPPALRKLVRAEGVAPPSVELELSTHATAVTNWRYRVTPLVRSSSAVDVSHMDSGGEWNGETLVTGRLLLVTAKPCGRSYPSRARFVIEVPALVETKEGALVALDRALEALGT